MIETAAPESIVESVECELLRVPLVRAVSGSSSRAGVTPRPLNTWDVIVVRIRTQDGAEGVGFTYELRESGEPVVAIIRTDLAPRVIGIDCWATERLWNQLYWATYNAGRRGVFIHALSAVDIALWDLKAKLAGVSLAKLLGADRNSVAAYESDSGWLNMPVDELAAASAAAVERGLGAVKIMVGSLTASEDVARVNATRRAIGPDAILMVDAGQKWDLRTAIDRIRRLEEFDLYWVEEPLACDDVAAHERLAEHVDTRIATGQSLTTRYELKPFLDGHCVDVVQVDAARLGGVTEWWRAAHLAEVVGVELAPHFLMELHVSLVAASPVGSWVEHTPWLSQILENPPRLVDGELHIPEGPGHGLRVSAEARRWRVQ